MHRSVSSFQFPASSLDVADSMPQGKLIAAIQTEKLELRLATGNWQLATGSW
jgi:hypothetical protein